VKTRPSLVRLLGILGTAIVWATPAHAADASVGDSGRPAQDGSAPGTDAAPPAPTHLVGKACTQNADCGAGLVCLASTGSSLSGSGPAGGVCSVDCATNGQADCNVVDTGSICVTVDSAKNIKYCFEFCIEGTPAAPTDKCHGRKDVACDPIAQFPGAGFCRPTCNADSDCGTRKCDPANSFCLDKVTGTLPFGSACDRAVGAPACKGICFALDPTAPTPDNSFCTLACVIDAPNACGADPTSAGPPAAACLIAADSASAGSGDLGFCAALCDCDGDCFNPRFVCRPLPAGLGVKRPGWCTRATDSTGVPVQGIACRDAGASPDGGNSSPDGGKKPAGGGGTPKADAGKAASPDGGAGQKKSGDSGGCGCRVGGGGGQGSGGAALLALALAVLARRRGARV
jgi:MYXO-CTERM domain-containing protein